MRGGTSLSLSEGRGHFKDHALRASGRATQNHLKNTSSHFPPNFVRHTRRSGLAFVALPFGAKINYNACGFDMGTGPVLIREMEMHCPDCGHDNIDGMDHCEACGQPLVDMDYSESELEQAITRETIESLKPHVPVAINPATTVRDAIQGLVARGIGCVLVEDGGELVGIFTERDVLNRISENPAVMDRPVQEFMTKSPMTVTLGDSIAFAMHTMDLGGYRHLPVVHGDGKPHGIISIRDILGYLCNRFAELSPRVS